MKTVIRFKKVTDYSGIDLSGVVSPERIKRAKRFKNESDYNRSICAEILLNEMIKEAFPDTKTPLTLAYDEKGKPYCSGKKVPPVFFSLSHSGDYAACIISDRSCGVDIERIRDKNITSLANRVLAPEESKKITAREFFETWTVKESVLKALGTGLSLDMRFISIDRYGQNITAKVPAKNVCIALGNDIYSASGEIIKLKGEILPAPEGYCLSYTILQ